MMVEAFDLRCDHAVPEKSAGQNVIPTAATCKGEAESMAGSELTMTKIILGFFRS